MFELVEWIERPLEMPWQGVLFANEVVDALPTPRFAMRGGGLGQHLAQNGRHLQAIDIGSALIAAEPDNAAAWHFRGTWAIRLRAGRSLHAVNSRDP